MAELTFKTDATMTATPTIVDICSAENTYSSQHEANYNSDRRDGIY